MSGRGEAGVVAQPSSSPIAMHAPSTPSAEEFRASWAESLGRLAQLSRSLHQGSRDAAIMRSTQLDAVRLDDELASMLREQFMRAFAPLCPAAVARLQPELLLLLDFLIFRFSVWEGRPLPGMALMNLRFRNESAVQRQQQGMRAAAAAGKGPGASSNNIAAGSSSSSSSSSSGDSVATVHCAGGRSGVEGPGLSGEQRALYCLGAVLLRYGWARLGHHAAAQHWGDAGRAGWRRRAWAFMRRAESAYHLAALLNFLVFLRTGKYRSLLERLLRARLVYQRPSAARAINFEYLNRQLVWSELSELLLFVLPLVNVGAIKHALRSYLPRLPILSGGGAGLGAAAAAGSSAGEVPQPCGICSTADVLEPYTAVPCGHRFCYYCLRSHCLADPQYSCPLCLQRVAAMQRAAVLPSGGGEGRGGSKDAGG